MELKIYSQDGTAKVTVSPSDNSTHAHELMGDNIVSLSFTLPEYVTLDVNDYIEIEGNRYTVRSAYQPQQKSTLEYTYNVKFYGRESETQRVKMLYLTDGDFEPKFSLDGSPAEHVQKVIDNLNRISGKAAWVLGSILAAPNQTIEYSNVYCSDALSQIATAFETEWWIEGNTLNLCRCEFGEPVELGYLKGLTELNREDNANNVKFFTRLIPLGTTRNIDRKTYGFSRLQLPDRARYVEQNMQYGLYEEVEEETFSGIYPKRVGNIDATRSEERTGEDKKKFIIYYFSDSGLNFNPNDYTMEGLVKHIVFQSGELNGRDFEVNYDATKREFEIITQYPDENRQLPGGHLIPGVDDKYILYNLKMPTEYITAAEQEYKKAVDDYLAKFSVDSSIYRGNTDYIYISEKNISLRIGRRVRLLSDKYFPGAGYRDSRITKVTRKLNNLTQATIECSNSVSKGRLASLESDVNEIKNVVADRLDEAVLSILRTWDSGDLTDYNLLSSKRTLKEMERRSLSRLGDDKAAGMITFLKGLIAEEVSSFNGGIISDHIQSKDFTEGALGSGLVIRRDPQTGKSYAEVDEFFVRLKATFRKLIIQEMAYVGGEQILSPASMECIKVEVLANAYRCYFLKTDGDQTIANKFVVNDQARRQTFNIVPGIHENVSNTYYWRLVTAIGPDYIDLSKTDCDTNSDAPAAGDPIVQLGNRTDESRQNAQIWSSYGADAPSYKQYEGINSYSLLGKEVTVLAPGKNKFTGKVTIESGSAGYENFSDKPDLDSFSTATKDVVAKNLGYSSFSAMLSAAEKGKTIIKGGVINAELIQAAIVITSQLIADAIRANRLSINDKFIVEKDGKFKATGGEMKDMLLTGAFRSPFKDGVFSWGTSIIATRGLQDNNNVIISNENSGAQLTCDLPCSMSYDGFAATILNEDFNGKQTFGSLRFGVPLGYSIYENGVELVALVIPIREGVDIQGFSDGTAFRGWIVKHRFKSSTTEAPIYGEVVLKDSPSGSGTVTGGGLKISGTTGTITAASNVGYVFSHWQDGMTTPSREVTWNESRQSFTAHFVGVEYTITVLASPTIGGTVNGGGRNSAGATGVIEAVANSGYAFSQWDDDNKNINRVVTWDGDKTYTAYFDVYTPSTSELLTNVNFTDTTAIANLETDLVGECRLTVFNKILLWNVLSGATGTIRGLTFNRGYLSGKLIAGKNYRFTVQVHSASNAGKNLMVLIGRPLMEPFVGEISQVFDAIGSGTTVSVYVFANDYITLTMDFTASHTATTNDCILFLSDALTGIINIKSPSLKEI